MRYHSPARASLLTATLLASAPCSAQPVLNSDQTAQVVSALPTSMREGATVIKYDDAGEPVVLRQGSNDVFCVAVPQTHQFAARCYSNALRPQRDLEGKLRAEGKNERDVQTAVKAAVAAGQIPQPEPGTVRYVRSGASEETARTNWIILLPGASRTTGLPEQADQNTPWLSMPGTNGAYLTVPQQRDN
jgi:hypothetical protein